MIEVKYFASLAETLNCRDEQISSSDIQIADMQTGNIATVAELKHYLSQRGSAWAEAINNRSTRCAVNQVLANDDTPVPERAEVAFFPPVTGG